MGFADVLVTPGNAFFIAVIGAVAFLYFARKRMTNQPLTPTGKAILITGCDSGFGRDAAIQLHRFGYVVFACCLDAASASTKTYGPLKNDPSFIVLQMDVTLQNQVDAVSKAVEKWLDENTSYRLFGVINNAGIGAAGPIEWVSTATFQKVLDINVTGVVRVAKALLPLMRRDRNDGRLVVVASIAGCLPSPGGGAYCASKAAVLAVTDIFRMELKAFGIKSIAICPDFYATDIITQTERNLAKLDSELSLLDPLVLDAYGGHNRVARLTKIISEKLPSIAKTDCTPVIKCIVDSITSPNPPVRYYPIDFSMRFAKFLKIVAPTLLDSLMIRQSTASPNEKKD